MPAVPYQSSLTLQGSHHHNNNNNNNNTLRFDDGAVQFRQRICVAILSHRRLLLRNIRSGDNNSNHSNNNSNTIGLQAHEASFLKLIDQMTNGTVIEINATGTQLLLQPGVLLGGDMQHDCPVRNHNTSNSSNNSTLLHQEDEDDDPSFYRSIGWYVEGILPLAPFGKEPLCLQLTGITDGDHHNNDPSCDYLRASALPLLTHFGVGSGNTNNNSNATRDVNHNDRLLDDDRDTPTLRVTRRGAAPYGGGAVTLYCPVVKSSLTPQPQQKQYDIAHHPNNNTTLLDFGRVRRVRGTAQSCRLVSSSAAARTAYAAKGVIHRLIPDVWIYTQSHTMRNHHCGPAPSLGLLLTAETTSGVTLSAEVCLSTANHTNITTISTQTPQPRRELPEELGVRGAVALLEEIRRGGCVDTGMQSFVLLLMCLTPEDVSRVRLGALSPYTIESLRLFRTVWGVEFKVQPDAATKTVLLSCLGTGYRNMARAST